MNLLKNLIVVAIILASQRGHAQWTNTGGPPSRYIKCFTVVGSSILAGTDGGLVQSTNNGGSWTNIGGGLPYVDIRALLPVTSYPFNVLAGMNSGRISQSSNSGSNWTGFPVDSTQPPALAHVNSILKEQNHPDFWVGTDRGVYHLPQFYPLSTWIPWHSGLASGEFTAVRFLLEKDGEIFAGANGGVYKLNVTTWVPKNSGLTNTNVTALGSTGGYLIAGTSQGSVGGVYISTNNGDDWVLSKTDAWVTSILTIGSTIFVGSFGDGVWRSTNFGSSWSQINTGFAGAAYYVTSLGADNQYIFAGTNNANVWRRPLSQITDIEDGTQSQPVTFSLEQNYPNPFNPATTIRYELHSTSHVTLKIINVLGEEVGTLVDEFLPTGEQSVRFDASHFSSGVYFYRLQAGTNSETKKLVLLR